MIAIIDEFPGLQVKTQKYTPGILTTYPEKYRHLFKDSHLSGFYPDLSVSTFGITDEFSLVSALYTYYGTVFIGLSDAKLGSVKTYSNTCCSEFLHPSYQKTHRDAFDSLHTKLVMKVPDEPLMIGIGSAIPYNNVWARPFVFKFKDNIFKISKWS